MTWIAISLAILLLLLLANRMPIAFAMLIAGAIGLSVGVGDAAMVGTLKTALYENAASYMLSTLPMFILMAEFLSAGRFTKDLFAASNSWLGHFKGGLAYASLAGGVLLAAICGSSTASAGTLASASYPEMKRYGYDDAFSTGLSAVVGTLAIMIPPSIGLIFYGILTETSIGDLLAAGLLPGLITAVGYAATIYLTLRLKPKQAPERLPRAPVRQRIASIKSVWPILGLMIFVLVAIYSGVITTTEVGAIGALAALVLAFAMGRLRWRAFFDATAAATRTSAMILIIVSCSAVFGIFLTFTGVTQDLVAVIRQSQLSPSLVLGIILLILLVMGCFLDQVAIAVLTLPLIFPLVTGLGYDPVWFGVVFVKTAEIGLITPPLGLNVFVVSNLTKVPTGTVFRGVWPFVVVELLILLLLVLVPEISLLIPKGR